GKRCPTPPVFATEARVHHLPRRAPALAGALLFGKDPPPDSNLAHMEKGPAGGSQRGQVEGGNAQEGRREETYRHHRSVGDGATIRGICPAQCEVAHTTPPGAFV